MAYVPLDQESKTKGKAAVDVVGARLGKTGGGIIFNIVIPSMGAAAFLPYAGVIVILVCLFWVFAVLYLGRRYNT